MIGGIRAELPSNGTVNAAIRAAHRVLDEQASTNADLPRIAELRQQIDHLIDAIVSVGLRSSPAIASRVTDAKEELARLESVKPAPKASRIIPRIAHEYRHG